MIDTCLHTMTRNERRKKRILKVTLQVAGRVWQRDVYWNWLTGDRTEPEAESDAVKRNKLLSSVQWRHFVHYFVFKKSRSLFTFLRRCKHDIARICCWPPCCCGYGSKGDRACCRRAVQQSIDVACPLGPQQQTCWTLLQQSNRKDRWTGSQTDTIPLHIPCRTLCDHCQ